MDVPLVLAAWLHTLAFVIAWGYYGILGRVVLPGLERSLDGPAQAGALVAIERRAIPLVVLSAVIFLVTGTYLLVSSPSYSGLGDVFASTWTVLMLGKHILVAILVVLAIAIDRMIRRLGAATGDRTSSLRRITRSAEVATGLGAVIVLLTAIAQGSV